MRLKARFIEIAKVVSKKMLNAKRKVPAETSKTDDIGRKFSLHTSFLKTIVPPAQLKALDRTRNPPTLVRPIERFSRKISNMPTKPNIKAKAFFEEKGSFKNTVANAATIIG